MSKRSFDTPDISSKTTYTPPTHTKKKCFTRKCPNRIRSLYLLLFLLLLLLLSPSLSYFHFFLPPFSMNEDSKALHEKFPRNIFHFVPDNSFKQHVHTSSSKLFETCFSSSSSFSPSSPSSPFSLLPFLEFFFFSSQTLSLFSAFFGVKVLFPTSACVSTGKRLSLSESITG